MTVRVEGYYTRNGILYKESADEAIQTEAHKVKGIASSLIQENEEAKEHVESHLSASAVYLVPDPLHDSWFWFNMYLLSSHSHFHPGGGGYNGGDLGNCCDVRGGSGEGCLVILLVAAIIALAAAIFAAAGFTVYQGIDAENTQQKIEEIKQLQQEATSEKVQQIYDQILPILEEEHIDKSLKTVFTASITLGFGFLTASAALALYAVLHNLPFSHLVNIFAITGGAISGAGILAHCMRPLILSSRKEVRLQKYQKIFEMVQTLSPHLVHPHEILAKMREEKAYIAVNGMIFAKNKTQIQRYTPSEAKRMELQSTGYAYKEIENRE